ncbi:putative Fe2OG dioxygenase domain-containing protein [Seiridium unicorne]|uniref:Fe2OG dioxygenase domain-containing protein n=1 Tax=Seiridium unicorne TaxID=138068 RepID=A0ABR2V9T2_9PEZI
MYDSVASLTTISVSKLLEGDEASAAQLLKACTEVGFFYLDLRSPKTDDTLRDVEQLFKTADDLFNLDVDEKRQYNTDKYNDSKVHGLVLDCHIQLDLWEPANWYEVSELGLFGLGDRMVPFAGPGPIQDAKKPLTSCIRSLHDISLAILSTLYESLGRPEGAPFQDCHRQDQASMTGLGLLRYQPLSHTFDKVGHLAHTDAGSLSFVFTNSGGLQVLMPDNSWQFVEPCPGHAVVNVGDTHVLVQGQVEVESSPGCSSPFLCNDNKDYCGIFTPS